MFRTNRDITVKRLEGTYKVPKGTAVQLLLSGQTEVFVVSNVSDAIKAGMSEHDAVHRYLFVPRDAVEKCEHENYTLLHCWRICCNCGWIGIR